jgi:hypothetical protein
LTSGCTEFVESAQQILEERKLNQTLLANHTTLLDLLEIPQLMDTYETLSFTIHLSLYFMFGLFVIDNIICFSVVHSFSCIVAELRMTVSKLILVGVYGMGTMMKHLI